MLASKTLEINPRHPIIVELNKLATSAPEEQSTKDLAYILYDTALLQSGFQFDETEAFAGYETKHLDSRIYLMKQRTY